MSAKPATATLRHSETGVRYLVSTTTTAPHDSIQEQAARFYGLEAEALEVVRVWALDEDRPRFLAAGEGR